MQIWFKIKGTIDSSNKKNSKNARATTNNNLWEEEEISGKKESRLQ